APRPARRDPPDDALIQAAPDCLDCVRTIGKALAIIGRERHHALWERRLSSTAGHTPTVLQSRPSPRPNLEREPMLLRAPAGAPSQQERMRPAVGGRTESRSRTIRQAGEA